MSFCKLKTMIAVAGIMGAISSSATAQSLEVDLSVSPTSEDIVAANSQTALDDDAFFSAGYKVATATSGDARTDRIRTRPDARVRSASSSGQARNRPRDNRAQVVRASGSSVMRTADIR